MRRASLWLPPIVYMFVIYRLSSESSPLPEVTEHIWDKLLHFSEYAGLALLFCRALAGEGLSWVAAALIGVALTSVYGASDEWHQAYVPLRTSDLLDWTSDTIGAAMGALAYLIAAKLKGNREN